MRFSLHETNEYHLWRRKHAHKLMTACEQYLTGYTPDQVTIEVFKASEEQYRIEHGPSILMDNVLDRVSADLVPQARLGLIYRDADAFIAGRRV